MWISEKKRKAKNIKAMLFFLTQSMHFLTQSEYISNIFLIQSEYIVMLEYIRNNELF